MTRDRHRKFFSETAEQGSLAETLAREAFVAANPDERVHRVRLRVEETERHVVLVQYGPVAELRYACYAVDKATRTATLIEDASPYLPTPEVTTSS
jgi:hypothetical protein